jgi:hypothetical protein
MTDLRSRYVVLLRRELVRALARLKRAEDERDNLAAEKRSVKSVARADAVEATLDCDDI